MFILAYVLSPFYLGGYPISEALTLWMLAEMVSETLGLYGLILRDVVRLWRKRT